MTEQFEITRNGTVMVFRVLEMDCPGDVWIITAEYMREYPAPRHDGDDATGGTGWNNDDDATV